MAKFKHLKCKSHPLRAMLYDELHVRPFHEVTTPQQIATGDVRRGIKMFERVNTRVLGIVENMSGMACPNCNEVVDVFGKGGGEKLAEQMNLPFLGRVPLDPAVVVAGDEGAPTVISAPESAAGVALRKVANTVESGLAAPVG